MIRQRARICMLYIIAAFAATFAACNGVSRNATGVVPNAISPDRLAPQLGSRALHFAPFAVVNTGNNSITLYRSGKSSIAGTIVDRVDAPKAVAFDRKGNLYIANARSVTVYAPGGTHALRTITERIDSPAALAFDKSDNLYVANQGNNSISVLGPEGKSRLRTISAGIVVPNALAFDDRGNLYVSNRGNFAGTDSSVTVYAPKKTKPTYTITDGVKLPLAIAIDRGRNVYVANVGSNQVTIYRAGSKTLERSISRGVLVPSALAFDADGNLFVASLVLNRITIYRHGGSKVSGSITAGLNYPNSMAFDSSGTLYVSNLRGNAVTAYAPKTGKYLRSVTEGVSQPGDVALAPDDEPVPSPSPTAQPSFLPQMLFVANTNQSTIDGYAIPLANGPPGSASVPSPSITIGQPNIRYEYNIAFNSLGDLFTNDRGGLEEFTPPYTNAPTLIPQVTQTGSSSTLVFDSNNEMYFSLCDYPADPGIEVLTPPYNGSIVSLGTSNNLAAGTCEGQGLAVNAQGDLFADDYCLCQGKELYGSLKVLEYQPPISSASLPALAIPHIGGDAGEVVAFDHHDNLWIATAPTSSLSTATIEGFAPPYTGSPIATISFHSGCGINAIVFDAADDLFAAACSVLEFVSPYTGAPAATLDNGNNAQSMAMSAGGNLYVYNWYGCCPYGDDVLEFTPPFTNGEAPSGYVSGGPTTNPNYAFEWVGIALSPVPPGAYYSPSPSPAPTPT